MGSSSSYSNYTPSYSYQEPSGRDNYGFPTYDRYTPSYAYQLPSGRDNFGNPIYNQYIIHLDINAYFFNR